MRLSIVVPTYNEAENVPVLIRRLEQVLSKNKIKAEVVIVDDGSPDRTADTVRTLQRKYRNLVLFARGRKRGIGAAYKFAFPKCRGEYIIEMDADLSHDPEQLPRLVEKLEEGYDLVIGSRYMEGGKRKDSLLRRIFPWIGNLLYRRLLGFPVTDTTSGYRGYRRVALQRLSLSGLPDDFSFQSAMVSESMARGLRITEVPITFRKRAAGRPKYSFMDLVGNIILLLRLFFHGLSERW